MQLFPKWKRFSELWTIIKPFISNLIRQNVPKSITNLYENLAKYAQPANRGNKKGKNSTNINWAW